jgi:rfaE bifunctional protein kinase chain/domain
MFKLDTTKKIVVIGDVMLDEYYIGYVSRMSPEAPVPVISLKDKHYNLGGAANVAVNLKSLGYNPVLISVIGSKDDKNTAILLKLLIEKKISSEFLLKSPARITTTKTRIIGDRNRHICRVDSETISPISEFEIRKLSQSYAADAIIFSDYNKGVCTKELVGNIMRYNPGARIMVDPKYDITKYRGAYLIKPNLKEALEISRKTNIEDAAKYFFKKANPKKLVITMGELGANLYEPIHQKCGTTLMAFPTKVVDMTGAGDTFIAALTASIVSGRSDIEAVSIANLAASISIEKLGVASVTQEELGKRLRWKKQ